MKKVLDQYIKDSTNPQYNFDLAKWYEDNKYLSPASSLYLRCADLTKDINLQYEALIRAFMCYDQLERRDKTCESILKQALSLCPKRKEAYYLLGLFYQWRGNYLESYTYSSIALSLDLNHKTIDNCKYVGDHSFYFQKACAAWNIGKSMEARKTYKYILDNFFDQLNNDYKKDLENNLIRTGFTNQRNVVKYKRDKDELKFKFDSYEKIEENFSQVYQDICLLTLLDGKKDGKYLEIGSASPHYGNNTALLESVFNWKGIGIEIDQNLAMEYNSKRINKTICADALDVNYDEILKNISDESGIIDYLQLDIEPSKNTYFALVLLPFDKYRFRFITYEHDHYVDMTKSYREKSRRFLQSLGYKLLINDIAVFGEYSFEDWWYHPELVDEKRVELIKNIDLTKVHKAEDIFLSS
jgi:tetratricopeptide (TPR) repeat protein